MRNGADTIIRAFENSQSMWQKEVRLINGVHRLELIRVGKALVLVQDYPNGDGWEAFVPVCDDGRVDATLRAIAARAGVEPLSVEAMKAIGVKPKRRGYVHDKERGDRTRHADLGARYPASGAAAEWWLGCGSGGYSKERGDVSPH